jgi:hypothetical protein
VSEEGTVLTIDIRKLAESYGIAELADAWLDGEHGEWKLWLAGAPRG